MGEANFRQLRLKITSEYIPHLNLLNMRRPDLGIFLHLFHHPNTRVADTNSLEPALFIQPLHRLPQHLNASGSRSHIVDEHEIQIAVVAINLLHTLQALLVGRLCVIARPHHFARDEDVFPRDSRLSDTFADLCLVAVDLSSVNVTVASLQGGDAGLDCQVLRAVL